MDRPISALGIEPIDNKQKLRGRLIPDRALWTIELIACTYHDRRLDALGRENRTLFAPCVRRYSLTG